MRRSLIVLAIVVLAGPAILYACHAGLAHFVHAMMQADPYPAFMANYQQRGSRSYEEAKRGFADFIAGAFPVGSDASHAIAQMTEGGFQMTTSTSETVELVWKRHAGPCNEAYSVVISRDSDGRIGKIVGRLRPICL